MKVSLREIVDSLEIQFDEQLDDLRFAEEGGDDDDEPEPRESDSVDIATAIIIDPDRFVRLPTQWDVHEWEIMREFADSVAPERLRSDLLNALHGSGAFRYFKDALRRYRCENDWYAYKTEALREIAIDWCKENKIEYEDTKRRS